MILNSLIFLFPILTFCLYAEVESNGSIVNILEHKTNQLNEYLNGISFNSPEKTELAKYIKSTGTYLEIGTGGDPISIMLSQIPADYSPTIIASDIDLAVLNSLPVRHPMLIKHLEADADANIPKLRLMQLDATDLSAFENESLSGINASSIVHEILSYAGGRAGLEKFFREAFRTLKKDGILVYRDPEGVLMPYKPVVIDLKSKIMKLFTHLFLSKFLDTKYSHLWGLENAQEKPSNYNKNELKFNFYKIGENKISSLTYEEYLTTPTSEVDFSRKYFLIVPRQLCREIERHYLTFLHDCNPFVFVKFIPDLKTDLFHVIFLSQRVEKMFIEFAKKYHIPFIDGKVDGSGKEKIVADIIRRMTHIENGIRIKTATKQKYQEFKEIISKNGFNPELYIQEIENHWLLLDYRIFGLLYRELNKWFDNENAPFGTVSESAAKWLLLEGEENYFYASADALISSIGHLTFQESLKNKDEYLSILCPISSKENRFVSRNHYMELLKDSIDITDEKGYPEEIKEGKRIIHFAKMGVEDALTVYSRIYEEDPESYPMLDALIANLHNYL